MSNLATLLKIEFRKFLSSLSAGKKKARQTPLLYVLLGLGVLFIAISVGYSFLIITSFVKAGADPSPAVGFFAGVVSLFVFMSSMSQARTIYIGEDYDFLSALPIKKREIVASKVISLYAMELSFSILIMIPHGIIMLTYANSLTCFFISLVLAFTLPIVPVAIAAFLSLLVAMATARFKSANLVFVILYALVIVGLSCISIVVNNMNNEAVASSFGAIGGVLKWINPTFILVEMSFNDNILYIILYIAINLIVAVITVLFLTLFFDKLHEIVSSISMKKKYVRTNLKVKSQGRILLGLEFKRLINSKVYFINSIMGSIMSVVGSAVFLISFNGPMASASPEAAEQMKLLAVPIFVMVVMLIIGLGNPTTGSINIEGKQFWLIKSLPTDYRKYMRTKLYFAWILTLPAILVASAICVILFHNTVWDILGAFLVPFAYTVLSSLVGLAVAIKHPKLKWNNEAEAVKNAASVLIAMLYNFLFTLILGTALIVFPLVLPTLPWLGPTIVFAIILVMIIITYIYLRNNFAKKISEMEDL